MSAGRIRVAVATDDGITSDVYFGRANRFVLAEIDGNKIIREGEILTENQPHPSNSSGTCDLRFTFPSTHSSLE